MTTRKFLSAARWLLILTVAASCVNLKAVNKYSTTSDKSLRQYDEIGYSFRQHCLEGCMLDNFRNAVVLRDTACHCGIYEQADSVTAVIYHALDGYFEGMAALSAGELTAYKIDTLKKALTEGSFGKVRIEKNDVDAYGKIVRILLRATTDAYRKRKLANYIGEANEPLQVLLKKFSFIIRQNLAGELNFRKEMLYQYYGELVRDSGLSELEKRTATADYYRQLGEVNAKQRQLKAYTGALDVIADGHQKLYERRNKISGKELKELLTGYASDLQDIISEIKKLNP